MHWQLQIGFHFSHVSHIFWVFKGKSNSPTFFRQFLAVFPTYPKWLNKHDKSKLHTQTRWLWQIRQNFHHFFFLWVHTYVTQELQPESVVIIYVRFLLLWLFYFIFASLLNGFALSGLFGWDIYFRYLCSLFDSFLTIERKTFRRLIFCWFLRLPGLIRTIFSVCCVISEKFTSTFRLNSFKLRNTS